MVNIVLASASMRRVELLTQLGLRVKQYPANIDESPKREESGRDYVCRLAQSKAESIAVDTDSLVIAADTTIEIDGTIIGKPESYDHFVEIFDQLSNTRHLVRTGVAVRQGATTQVAECETQVWMRAISAVERDAYWRCGEPHGKAGGYAIQGRAAGFIACIKGSYSNVVGLPLFETTELLVRFGVSIFDAGDEPALAREI